MTLTDEMKTRMRISYALRRVPEASFASLLPCPDIPHPGDIMLARLEKIGKNTHLELVSGRRCTLHEHDLLAVVFGNRYATRQFEGYAHANGAYCDLLCMSGVCGLVESKHTSIREPTKLCLLGALGDPDGHPLRLGDFALPSILPLELPQPQVIAVCGSAMDAGKTYTVMSLIIGLRQQGYRVAAIKLTGTATGSDRWSMLDAGACVALEFIDGGFPSTYLCTVDELHSLYTLLLAHASAQGADWVVVEIADGLLQPETAALLQTSRFTTTVNTWILATSDPLGAVGGMSLLHSWGVELAAISGSISMSQLGIREVEAATGLPCLTAKQLQCAEDLAQRLQVAPHSSSCVSSSTYEQVVVQHV